MPGICACGLKLHIWQNPWNHEPGCSMQSTNPVRSEHVNRIRYPRPNVLVARRTA